MLHLQHFQVIICLCLPTRLHCVYRHAWSTQHRPHCSLLPSHCLPAYWFLAGWCVLPAGFIRTQSLDSIDLHKNCSPQQLQLSDASPSNWRHLRELVLGPHTPQTGQLLAACHSLEVAVQSKHFHLQSPLWLDPVSAHCNMGDPAGAGFPVLCECDCRDMPYALKPRKGPYAYERQLAQKQVVGRFQEAFDRTATHVCVMYYKILRTLMHRLVCQ